jgi:hypothetical protein
VHHTTPHKPNTLTLVVTWWQGWYGTWPVLRCTGRLACISRSQLHGLHRGALLRGLVLVWCCLTALLACTAWHAAARISIPGDHMQRLQHVTVTGPAASWRWHGACPNEINSAETGLHACKAITTPMTTHASIIQPNTMKRYAVRLSCSPNLSSPVSIKGAHASAAPARSNLVTCSSSSSNSGT